ncbi:MAG: formyl transferase [Planctomycetota bacterium]
MRIGILTSVERRHRHFVRALHGRFGVVAVVYEQIDYTPAEVDTDDLTPAQAQIVADHFAERARQETVFFGGDSEFVEDGRSCRVRHLARGALNTTHTVEFLRAAGADTVVIYGTNLIKPPLLGAWPGRMVNMHLGLSPYYRGTATNFYPLLNEEPEYVGATIHLLDAGIDSGPILAHARPEIVADDMPHTIGCKAILAGIARLIAVLRDLDRGHLTPVPQWEVPNARLYLRKHYHPRQVVELYRKIDAGLIPRYVGRAAQAARRVRLVD